MFSKLATKSTGQLEPSLGTTEDIPPHTQVFAVKIHYFKQDLPATWNTSSNADVQEDQSSSVSSSHLTCALIGFVLITLSVVADLLMIFVMEHHKGLKKNGHIYLLHYAVFSAIDFLLYPIFELTERLGLEELMGPKFSCATYNITNFTTLVYLWMILAAGLDWYVQHENFQKNCIVLIYGGAMLQFIVLEFPCFFPISSFLRHLGILNQFVMTAILIYVNFNVYCNFSHFQQRKFHYLLKISTLYFLLWSPILFLYFIMEMDDYPAGNGVKFYAYVASDIAVSSGPIFVAVWLGLWSENFKAAFKSMFNSILGRDEKQ